MIPTTCLCSPPASSIFDVHLFYMFQYQSSMYAWVMDGFDVSGTYSKESLRLNRRGFFFSAGVCLLTTLEASWY